MALPKFLQRKDAPPVPPAGDPSGDEQGPVQAARTRARRRLIGAVVLLALGVLVFPMLFETQPRPLPADTRKAEADRARALLEGRAVTSAPAAASASGNGRYVVQVGAYTDAATLREVRAKVEKLGLKTYTQSIDTEAGKRTRVRVGPFATRQEADSASARLKGAGLPGNVLTL